MTGRMFLAWAVTILVTFAVAWTAGWYGRKRSRAAERATEAARLGGYDDGLMTDQVQAVEDAWKAGRDWAFARARETGTEHRHRRRHWWQRQPARLADDDAAFDDWQADERATEHVPRHGHGSVSVMHGGNGVGGAGGGGGGVSAGGGGTFELPRQPYQPHTGTYGHETPIDRAALAELAAAPVHADDHAGDAAGDDQTRPRIHERTEPPSLISVGPIYTDLVNLDDDDGQQLAEDAERAELAELAELVERHAQRVGPGHPDYVDAEVVEDLPAVPVFRSSPAPAQQRWIAVDPGQCSDPGTRWDAPHDHDDDGWCPVDGMPDVCETTRDDLVPIAATDGLSVAMSQREFELTLHAWTARVQAEGAGRTARMLGDIEGGGWRDDMYPESRPAIAAPKRLALPAGSGRV